MCSMCKDPDRQREHDAEEARRIVDAAFDYQSLMMYGVVYKNLSWDARGRVFQEILNSFDPQLLDASDIERKARREN